MNDLTRFLQITVIALAVLTLIVGYRAYQSGRMAQGEFVALCLNAVGLDLLATSYLLKGASPAISGAVLFVGVACVAAGFVYRRRNRR